MRHPVALGRRQVRDGTFRRGELLGQLLFACEAEDSIGAGLVEPQTADMKSQQAHQEDEDDPPAERVWNEACKQPHEARCTDGTNM